MHRNKLVAKAFGRGSTADGFANFSATTPLELVQKTIQLVATALLDRDAWFDQERRENISETVMMYPDISRVYFHAPCKEAKDVEVPLETWNDGNPEYVWTRRGMMGISSMDGSECHCTPS